VRDTTSTYVLDTIQLRFSFLLALGPTHLTRRANSKPLRQTATALLMMMMMMMAQQPTHGRWTSSSATHCSSIGS
jgi:hypothetical protein